MGKKMSTHITGSLEDLEEDSSNTAQYTRLHCTDTNSIQEVRNMMTSWPGLCPDYEFRISYERGLLGVATAS